MRLILKISLRNLLRQKRRNILLGIGIAFGMCMLVLANAFSHGISDIFLNRLAAKIDGHLMVNMYENGRKEREIIRDKARIRKAIAEHVDGVKEIRENVFAEGRARGNDNALEFVALAGLTTQNALYREAEFVAGNPGDFTNPNIENPVVIFEQLAEDLSVRVNETFSVRFQTVYGQVQTARLTVIAIMKSGNPFMDEGIGIHRDTLKSLLGYQEQEAQSFSVILKHLKNPQVAVEQANRLHEALHPKVAGYRVILEGNNGNREVDVFAVAPDAEARKTFASHLQIVEGSLEDIFHNIDALLLSQSAANALGVQVGDEVGGLYETRFEGISPVKMYQVGAIFRANDVIHQNMVFWHDKQFYRMVFPTPPKNMVEVKQEHPLFPLLLKEWTLLRRTPDTTALEEKYQALEAKGWQGSILDVQTMYEFSGDILELEEVLDLITMVAVLVLFFILLIGVVNTLRMTIRERTREIGTVRAIGMQRSAVRWNFVTETLLLAFFACITGIALAFLFMKLLSVITLDSLESYWTICLVDYHLHFVPTFSDIVKNLVIILGITLITSYLPAGRAAKLSVAEALRHYE